MPCLGVGALEDRDHRGYSDSGDEWETAAKFLLFFLSQAWGDLHGARKRRAIEPPGF